MMINVGIVEDEKQIREGISVLVNGSEGFRCVHSYASAEDAIAGLPGAALDVVLMDIHLPGMSGIECIQVLRSICPKTQFIMFTSFEDSELVFKALRVGASGYLTKTTQPSRILDAIVDTHKGGSPMSSHIARKVVSSFYETEDNKELQKLSAREKEILTGIFLKRISLKENLLRCRIR